MINDAKEKILYTDESYAIRGAIFDVYREMGSGFLEVVYQECLEKEFNRRAQVFHYLKATGLRLGILVNFGHYPKATIERIVL